MILANEKNEQGFEQTDQTFATGSNRKRIVWLCLGDQVLAKSGFTHFPRRFFGFNGVPFPLRRLPLLCR